MAFRSNPSAPVSDFFQAHATAENIAALFEHLPRVYLFVKNRDNQFIHVNRSWMELFGCASQSEVFGKTDYDFNPPALAAQYVEEDRRVMKTRQILADQVWLVPGGDGLPLWYYCTKLPLLDRRQNVIGVVGFMRPCEEAGEAPGDFHRLSPACQYVLAHYAEPITIADLAKRAHLSTSQFQREFRRLFGMSPGDYLLHVRLLMARRALEKTSAAVGTIALDCGFYDQSHFNRAFRLKTGLRPLEYRRLFTPKLQRPSPGGATSVRA